MKLWTALARVGVVVALALAAFIPVAQHALAECTPGSGTICIK